MNWTRVLMAGVAAGIATNLADFAMHGVIMANTYKKYTEVFSQTPANPLWFLAVALSGAGVRLPHGVLGFPPLPGVARTISRAAARH